jgi:hypothetical protein
VQDVAKPPQCLARGCRARIRVDLHRDCLISMPKYSRDHARVHIEVDEQRCASAPGVMNSGPTHSRSVAARRELSVESAEIN